MDSQRPSRVCTLFATATWVCRSRSPARLSQWVNAVATRPRTLTCRMPLWPGPGEQGMLLNEGQGVLDRGLLGSFDHRCHCRVGDCHNVDTDRQLLGVHQRTIMRVA